MDSSVGGGRGQWEPPLAVRRGQNTRCFARLRRRQGVTTIYSGHDQPITRQAQAITRESLKNIRQGNVIRSSCAETE